VTNPKTGKQECNLVNLEAVYPQAADGDMSVEFSFEELRARARGWLNRDWRAEREKQKPKHSPQKVRGKAQRPEIPRTMTQAIDAISPQKALPQKAVETRGQDSLQPVQDAEKSASTKFRVHNDEQQPAAVPEPKLQIHQDTDENAQPCQQDLNAIKAAKKARREEKANRTRKIRVLEVKNESQTVQTNLASPTGPKIKRKKSAEPTMTVCTKEALDEVYDLFNAPLKQDQDDADTEAEDTGDESDGEDDDDYTSAGESTGTGRISTATSDFGEDDQTGADFTEVKSATGDETQTTGTSATSGNAGWTEFSVVEQIEEAEDDIVTSQNEGTADVSPLSIYTNEKDERPESGQIEDEDLVTPISPEYQESPLQPRYVPLPPDDYAPSTRPYRDSAQVAQNRLPFMTPIVEKTESSLGTVASLAQRDYFTSKTPSRHNGLAKTPTIPEFDDLEPGSSPFDEQIREKPVRAGEVKQPDLPKLSKIRAPLGAIEVPLGVSRTQPSKGLTVQPKEQKFPLVKDAQCNPMDEHVRQQILSDIQPPLHMYSGFHEDRHEKSNRGAEIRKFVKAVSKMSRNSAEKTSTNISMPPVLELPTAAQTYTVKRELGKGAFAPVYLVETSEREPAGTENERNAAAQMGKGDFAFVKREQLEAVKMEDPPSAWEFYILRQAKRRLGISRPSESIVHAHECHVFAGECFLVEQYRDQGTLLNLVNVAKADPNLGASGTMDEQLVMFFTVEILRTVEALHSKGIIHGDLKADNVLLRLDDVAAASWSSVYTRDGRQGWCSKGVALIDFGRGIDMKAFYPDVQFIADWKTSEADCAEMRELRPWTYQVDYHGVASIVHTLLFGKYIETVAERGGGLGQGATKTYRIREGLKRYWQTEIWTEVFDMLLNPLSRLEGEEGKKMPISKGLKAVREKMEGWLEANAEKGVGLKGMLKRAEGQVRDKRK